MITFKIIYSLKLQLLGRYIVQMKSQGQDRLIQLIMQVQQNNTVKSM